MSRELKRVALDFDHPIRKTWPGYVNNLGRPCASCGGSGSTSAMQRLSDLTSLIMLSGEDAQRGKCHPYFDETPLYHTEGVVPSKDMVALTIGLAGRELSGLGHDTIDRWRAVKKIIAAAGLPETWGRCEACDGQGDDPETRAASEAWTATEPPAGEGWQMWETTSEGSPISPVFDTPERLAQWLANTGASAFGKHTATYDAWMEMILGAGWAPSAVSIGGKMMDGVTALARVSP